MENHELIKYTIFKTKWGYFGLAGTELWLCRSCLPLPQREKVESQLLAYAGTAEYDKGFFKTLQEQITAYFEGALVNFSPDIPIVLDGLGNFAGQVLTACRDIKFGQTISYSGLAKRIGRAGSARAIGNTLAKNPLPLIIPCHRVIKSNGEIGGFSAVGGKNLKAKLLRHEQETLMNCKSGELNRLRRDFF